MFLLLLYFQYHAISGKVTRFRSRKNSAMKKNLQKVATIIDRIFWTDYSIGMHNQAIGFHTPNYRFEKNQIAFIHVPKSGGTSLRDALTEDSLEIFTNLGK